MSGFKVAPSLIDCSRASVATGVGYPYSHHSLERLFGPHGALSHHDGRSLIVALLKYTATPRTFFEIRGDLSIIGPARVLWVSV